MKRHSLRSEKQQAEKKQMCICEYLVFVYESFCIVLNVFKM